MNLLFVTTQKDISFNRIIEEAEKKGIKVSKLLYEKLHLHDLKPKEFRKFDFCILRDPYNTGTDFSVYLRTIASFFKSKQLDYKTYKEYPFYEDKLFQHILFGNIFTMPKFYHYNTINEIGIKSFPIVIKKRISSRGKDVFILNTKKEIDKFFSKNRIVDYLFEDYINIKKDVRVILLGNKIVGVVERKTRFKENRGYRGVGVKVLNKYELPEKIKKKAILVSKIIKSDFCGVDFLIDKDKKDYLLECNISPQFVSSERVLGINIAKELIDILKRVQ